MSAQDDRPRSIEERLLDTPRRVAGVDSSGEPVRLGGHRLVAGRQSLGSFSGLRSWSISPGGMAIERKSRGRGVGRRLLHGAVPTDFAGTGELSRRRVRRRIRLAREPCV
jgi:hypothetical protein